MPRLLARALLGIGVAGLPMQAGAAVIITDGAGFVREAARGPGGGGLYGVELRGGRAGRADWELGVGEGTSRPGRFSQGEYAWGTAAHPFTLTWDGAGIRLRVGATEVSRGATVALVGNTLAILVNRAASVTLTSVDGRTRDLPIVSGRSGMTEVYFVTTDDWGGNGLRVTGEVTLAGGGGSANLVQMRVGESPVPVPAPAALGLMAVALGGLALARRLRRRMA